MVTRPESPMQIDPDQSAELSAMQQLIGRNILLPLFENSSSFIIVLDAGNLRIVAANERVRTRLSLGMRGLQQQSITDALPDLPPDRVIAFLERFVRIRRRKIKLRIVMFPDAPTTFEVDILRLPGRQMSLVLQAQDMTSNLNALRMADEAEERLVTAIDALSDGFVLYDAQDRLVICNQTYRDFYPESAAAMVPGTTFESILRYGLERGQYADAFGREEAWLANRLAQHQRHSGEVEQKLSNGRWLRILERGTRDGGLVGLRVDITTLKEQQHALRRLAVTDELTGLRNRRNLLEDIAILVDEQDGENVVVVFHMDLDRFKAINDVYGHEAGDHVLKHCAAVLESALPQGDFAARVGGDEFIIVRRMSRERADIMAFADQMIARMMQPITYAGQFLHIGASVGIAILETGGGMTMRGTVLTAADLALYEAKKLGSVAQIYEPQMREQVLMNNIMARELQTGLKRHEFEAFFQPQIDARTGHCVGFEALIRWIHPHRGVLTAGDFLSVAQRSGLTDALDTLMMDEACRALRWLHDRGLPDVSVSINMSTAQLSDPRLLSRLQAALQTHDVPCHLLRIELLESTLLDERTTHFVANVHALVNAGFVVELDDFGTGHAAIAALRKFKVSQIKIDRSFIRFIDKDVELQKLTAAIIGLARSLDISVLAEGVETQAEQDWLLRRGCPLAQGWLHSKAIPLSALGDYLDSLPP